MKLTKKIEQEVLKVYNTGWDAYMRGDLKTHAACLSRDFKIIGTTEGENFSSKKAWLAFCKKTMRQVVGVVQMRNRKIRLEAVGDGVMVVEHSALYVLMEGKWRFYSKLRVTALMRKEKSGWKYVHQHGSLPDTRASENETIATEKIKKENQQLREAVKRRTVELEHKNRELAIEAAMEKVRARSLAMQKPEELAEVAEVLRKEMGALGVEELETSSIYIVNENETTECWYAIKDVRGKNEKLVTDHMTLHLDETWVGREMQKFYRSKQTRTSILMRGKNRKEWINYCADKSSVLQGYYGGEIPERTYHLLKFSNGFMGAASPGEISAESWDLLKRATGVFSFSYKRFSDLQKAEEQAREAQLQLALERVRARTMAMQKSEELPEAAALLFQQVQSLGMPAWSAGYCLWNDDDKKSVTLWMSSEGVIQPPFTAPTTKDALFIQMRKGAEEGKTLHVVEMGGKQLVKHYQYMRSLSVVGEILDSIVSAGHPLPTFQIMHQAYFSKGFLLFITYQPVPDVHEIFKRFAKVFDQTYIRFLDLQKAEAQAREAQIEAALERVRSRSMAMHKSDELLEAGEILFSEMQKLGIESLTAGLVLMDKEEKNGLNYTPDPSTKKIMSLPVIIPHNETIHMQRVVENWKGGISHYVVEMDEDETIQHQTFIAERSTNFTLNAEQLIAISPARLFLHNFYFKEGYLLIVGGTRLSAEQNDIMLRFANVFQQTYTRFLDLQKAEAQAREAEIQLALERVRAQTMAMHNSEDMGKCIVKMFSELTALGVDE
ncbi:MAG: nuclear transport factor 2 family protein, partial [Cyclobacteriaceae bacterium]|nr:nuclear transport factor 2 family protein [Cyclobacteriaceae bacterium]